MLSQRLLNIRLFTLLGIATLATLGCTQSELSGNVYLTYGAGDVKPVAGSEVYLWSGTAEDLEREIGTQYAEWATQYLLKRSDGRLNAEVEQLQTQAERVSQNILTISQKHSWASSDSPPKCNAIAAKELQRTGNSSDSPTDVRAVLQKLNEDFAAKNRRLASLRHGYSKQKDARLRELDQEISESTQGLASLTKRLAEKKKARLADLKKDYITRHLFVETLGFNGLSTISAKFSNSGNLAVRSVSTSLAINGTILFDPVDGENWSYFWRSHDFLDPRRKNQYGEYIKGLAPDEHWTMEIGFYPSGLRGDELRKLRSLGFNMNQYADADVVIIDADLTSYTSRPGGPANFLRFPADSIESVFVSELAATYFSETDEIATIQDELRTTKKSAEQVAAAAVPETDEIRHIKKEVATMLGVIEPVEKLLASCDQLAEWYKEKGALEKQLLAATGSGHPGVSDAALVKLATAIAFRPHEQRSLVRELMGDSIFQAGGDVEYWNSGDDSGDLVLQEIFAGILTSGKAARSDISGAYSFPELDRDDYVLISGTSANDDDEAWWFVPVKVAGTTTQELANFNVQEGHLVQHLATFAIGYIQDLPDEQPQ